MVVGGGYGSLVPCYLVSGSWQEARGLEVFPQGKEQEGEAEVEIEASQAWA